MLYAIVTFCFSVVVFGILLIMFSDGLKSATEGKPMLTVLKEGGMNLVVWGGPLIMFIGFPCLAYLFETRPKLFDTGLGKPFGILVLMALAIMTVGACIQLIRKAEKGKSEHKAILDNLKKRFDWNYGDGSGLLQALSICCLPINAKHPITGKVYTDAEMDDPYQVNLWFHGPRETIPWNKWKCAYVEDPKPEEQQGK